MVLRMIIIVHTINGGDLPNGIIDSPGIDKKINNSYYE